MIEYILISIFCSFFSFPVVLIFESRSMAALGMPTIRIKCNETLSYKA